MREKPDLADDVLSGWLQTSYGLRAAEIGFLPLGADWNTAVYRVVTDNGSVYFLKLRGGVFDEASVAVPQLLHEQRLAPVIPPLPVRDGRLWTRMEPFAVVLYPFVEGRDGYQVALSDVQWMELGAAVRGIQAARLPEALAGCVSRERFTPQWGEILGSFQARAERERFDEPVAAEMAALLRAESGRIGKVVARAEQLATRLRDRAPAQVLCHGDMHAGNVLVSADGALRVVDWDTLVFAPPERDLEQVGGGWGGTREAELFYRGFGAAEIDQEALAYYRYHRVLEDLMVACEQLLARGEGGENRAAELSLAARVLRPGGAVDVVRGMDRG
jgi:spectinomycin phosphotransferase